MVALTDIQYRNISHLMLGGDHYKWRAMLSNGADESMMYGDKGSASDWEKFYAHASMLKYAIGNPLGDLTSTMTVGYVSAKDRDITTESTIIS